MRRVGFEGNINIFSLRGGLVIVYFTAGMGDWRFKLKVQISLKLDEELKARIDQAANHLTVSTASFVRMACMEYADKVLEAQSDEVKA